MSFGVNSEIFLNRGHKNALCAPRSPPRLTEDHVGSCMSEEADFEHTMTQITLKRPDHDFSSPRKLIAMSLDTFRVEE